jgi:hypothetical protein
MPLPPISKRRSGSLSEQDWGLLVHALFQKHRIAVRFRHGIGRDGDQLFPSPDPSTTLLAFIPFPMGYGLHIAVNAENPSGLITSNCTWAGLVSLNFTVTEVLSPGRSSGSEVSYRSTGMLP